MELRDLQVQKNTVYRGLSAPLGLCSKQLINSSRGSRLYNMPREAKKIPEMVENLMAV
jgi:hypothetical protein